MLKRLAGALKRVAFPVKTEAAAPAFTIPRWRLVGSTIPIGYHWKTYASDFELLSVVTPVPVTDDMLGPGEITIGFNSDSSRAYVLSCAYVFARAARQRDAISILDFGGALGGYYRIARNAIPDVKIHYTVFELPALCEFGTIARPDVRFVSSEVDLDGSYNLILASGALQYFEDWKSKFARLAALTESWLFVTRVMIVADETKLLEQSGDHGAISVWAFSQADLLLEAERHHLAFVDVFDLQEQFEEISGMDEQPKVRGYLFRKKPGPATSSEPG